MKDASRLCYLSQSRDCRGADAGVFRAFFKICTLFKAFELLVFAFGTANWAFPAHFLYFVPFFLQNRDTNQEIKGTKLKISFENAQFGLPTARNRCRIRWLRGTDFSNQPENAQSQQTP
jgi:hypothetical protein